jgi:ribonuclease P protein component
LDVRRPPPIVGRAPSGDHRDEENLSAEPNSAEACPRVSSAHAHQGWTGRAEAPPGEGSQAAHRHDRFEVTEPTRGGSFSRDRRLRDPRDFRRVTARGRRVSVGLFTSFLCAARATDSLVEMRARIGLTVSRKVGNAVARNRIKRQVREWFRRGGVLLPPGRELVVIARSEAGRSPRRRIRLELARLGERLEESARGGAR